MSYNSAIPIVGSPSRKTYIYKDQEYDMGNILNTHPGGPEVLRANKDVTPFIEAFHSRKTIEFLNRQSPLNTKPKSIKRKPSKDFFQRCSGQPICNLTKFSQEKDVHYVDGREQPVPKKEREIHEALRKYVDDKACFPCVAAKTSVTGRSSYVVGVYEKQLGDGGNTPILLEDLRSFIGYQSHRWTKGDHFTTFVAIFPNGHAGREHPKADGLWSGDLQFQLDELEKQDVRSQSATKLIKRSYQAVELGPDHAKTSRRFSLPMIAFNSVTQFGFLEDTSQFTAIQQSIKKRDKQISGSDAGVALPSFGIFVPEDVKNNDVQWIQDYLRDRNWAEDQASISMVLERIETCISLIKNKGDVLTKVSEAFDYFSHHQQDKFRQIVTSCIGLLEEDHQNNLMRFENFHSTDSSDDD